MLKIEEVLSFLTRAMVEVRKNRGITVIRKDERFYFC